MATQYGLVTHAQALELGATPRLIKRLLAAGEWISVYRGVYRGASVPVTWHQQLFAACLRVPGRAWASHRSSAALWYLDDCDPGMIEISTTGGLRSDEGVVVHRLNVMLPANTTFIGVIPVTGVARTLLDLGAVWPAEKVEAALEAAIRQRPRVLSQIKVLLEGIDNRGHRGAGVLRGIMKAHDGRPTESALETRFAQLLRRHRLPMPDRQHTIHDDAFVARVDFIYEGSGVVIEVDGRAHHLRRKQWEADLRRRNQLTSRGFRVLHATYDRIRSDANGIASEIRGALDGTEP